MLHLSSENSDYWKSFSSNLQRLRIARGLSQHELGEIVGVSGSYVGYWEHRKRFPEANELLKLADYFNKPLDDLFARNPLGGPANATNGFDPVSFRKEVEALVQAGQDIAAHLKKLEFRPLGKEKRRRRPVR